MEDILKECEPIIDEVCEKYNYDREDTEGNDSLRTVLLKAVPAMLNDSPKEDRNLFYQMLQHTPIVITEDLTKEGLDELEQKYIGNAGAKVIEEEEADFGDYGDAVGKGAYVSEPIIDENMHLIGKKSFVYIQKVSDIEKEFFGTDINVSHLIHELGHAWHAEKDQFIMSDDGIFTERVGAAKFKYRYSKNEEGIITRKNESVSGLLIEESMNTIAEEKAMANYMGISREEMQDAYSNVLVKSNYQGMMSDSIEYLLEKNSAEGLERWRLHGDEKEKDKLEELISKTPAWKKMTNGEPMHDEFNYENKRKTINQADNNDIVQKFFAEREAIYFPDVSNIKPIDKLNNVLEQAYDLKVIKYSMELENYMDFTDQMLAEFYVLVNQAEDLKIKENVSNVKSSEVNAVTRETKNAIKILDKEEQKIEGEIEDERQ